MRLRPATDTDAGFFFAVRNDPDTIAHSWSKRGVGLAEHDTWWRSTQDARFVAESAGEDVGVLRVSRLDESTGEVHIAVGAAYRGEGYSGEMLREGTLEAAKLGYTRIVARVDADNTPSLRAFLRAGYAVTSPGTLLLERVL